MKLVFLIGSQREGSLNKLLAKEIEKEFDDYDIVEYYPDDFKMFNGDLEKPEESWIKEIRKISEKQKALSSLHLSTITQFQVQSRT